MDSRALLAIAVTLLFWASAFAGIRAGLTAFSPGSLALLRFLTASVVLVMYAIFTGIKLPQLRDFPSIAAAAFLGISFYHVSLNYGEITVTAGSAGFLIGTVPIFSALLAVVLLGERLDLRSWIGIATSFFGITLIALGEGEGAGLSLDRGALFILAAAFATSIFFVIQKPYLDRYGALQYTNYAFWFGTAFMLIFLPQLIDELQAAPPAATLTVVYLGVFPSAISYVAWAYALKRAPVSNVTSFLYVSPVLACLIAWLWLGERPSLLALVGGGTALLGVVIVNTRSKR
jgi:drug/metabolite transporter (DMT)-like permease